ncbi:MAG: SPFH domain-containing protein [Patescibacteria group bacterium]
MFGLLFGTGCGIILVLISWWIKRNYGVSSETFDSSRYQTLNQKFRSVWNDDEVSDEDREEYEEYLVLKKQYDRIQNTPSFVTSLSPVAWRKIALIPLLIGVLVILWRLFLIFYIVVPQDNSVHAKRKYFGSELETGQIIARDGQNGPQMRIYPPGLTWAPLLTLTHHLEEKEDVIVPAGKVLTLIARDGKDMPSGQLYAPIWDEELDKKRILEDAEYALKHIQKGPQSVAFGPGTYRFNQYLWKWSIDLETTKVKPGEVAIVKCNYGKRFNHQLLYTDEKWKKMFPDFLTENDRPIKQVAIEAGLTPFEWKPTKQNPEFDYTWLDDKNSKWHNYYPEEFNYLTKDMVVEAKLVPEGYQGVWWNVLTEGEYALHREALDIKTISTRGQNFSYKGGFTVNDSTGRITFKSNQKVPEGLADFASDAISSDGFGMAIEYRIQAKVTRDQAAYAFVMWGNWIEIENRSITPDSRSSIRNSAQDVPCLDYFQNRQRQERLMYADMWMQALSKGYITMDVNYGKIHIPTPLLTTQTERVLAEQNKLKWEQVQLEQQERIKAEEKKAEADQQSVKMEAKIASEKASFEETQMLRKGRAQRKYDEEIAKGLRARYEAMADIIGSQNVAILEMLDRLNAMGVTDITPDVFTQNLGGAQSGQGVLLDPLMGTILNGMMQNKYGLGVPQPADSTATPNQ